MDGYYGLVHTVLVFERMKIVILILISSVAGAASASEFASTLVYASGTFGGVAPYNTPSAVLGEPAGWIDDDDYFDPIACSLVYGAWSVSPDGQPVITTIDNSDVVIVGFDHRVLDDSANPYGVDFIVFGNLAYNHSSQAYVGPNTDMNTVYLPSSEETLTYVGNGKVKVEVAQEPNGPWFGFHKGPFADSQFPTNRFAWDGVNKQWGAPLDPLKPVNPALQKSDFAGLSVPSAIALYEGSAGGTGYDLQRLNSQDYQQLSIDPQTGRRWIQYVRLTPGGAPRGQVDAISDVAPANVPAFPRGDLTYDYRVNLADLAILAENWMVCTWNCTQ